MLKKDVEREKVKSSFWASETEKPLFDLYHQWIGTPATNPIDAEKLVVFSAGKMMEVALIENLQAMGMVRKFENDEQQYIRITREGIEISGYIDGIFVDGTPLEVKTFYGDYQARELKAGKPKTAYLKQLAIYMDALNQNRGKLMYMDRGTGEMYEFTLTRESGLKFKCMNIEFDLTDTYKRWAELYKNNIIPRIEPRSEFRYKYPVQEIAKASKTDISKARTNSAVYGDWQVKYSPYKNLIIQREGCGLGYSDDEIQAIKELTKGYSSKY